MNKIKKIMFLEDIFKDAWNIKETKDEIRFEAILVVPKKWYDVKFESKDNVVYIISENKEKIGISLDGLYGKYIVQR